MNIKTWVLTVVVLAALAGVFYTLTKVPPDTLPQPAPHDPPLQQLGQSSLTKYWDSVVKDACQPALGSPGAEWTIVEIGDFACPMCAHSRTVVEKLVSSSKGNLRLYFSNFPIEDSSGNPAKGHQNSESAARAVLAAGKQAKFWPMYDVLYGDQEKLEDEVADEAYSSYISDSQTLDLNREQFVKDMKDAKIQARLSKQIANAKNIGVQSTPTFILRQNGSKKIYWFIGLNNQASNPGRYIPAYPGLETLQKNVPWEGKTLPDPVQ
jgi:protein-disulfide isomerase